MLGSDNKLTLGLQTMELTAVKSRKYTDSTEWYLLYFHEAREAAFFYHPPLHRGLYKMSSCTLPDLFLKPILMLLRMCEPLTWPVAGFGAFC